MAQAKKQGPEHRRAPRYTKILNIDCVIVRFPDDIVGEKAKLKVGESFRATSINVSETGMLVNCDVLMPERTVISVGVPGGAVETIKDSIKLKVEIAWTKRNAYQIFGRYAAGLHIVEGKKEDIKKLIEHFN